MDATLVRSEAVWLRFMSRWALLTAVGGVALFLAFPFALAFDATVPQDYASLLQATQRPVGFRIVATLDVLVFLLNAVLFLAFAGLFARRSPVRAGLLILPAVGFVISALGAYIWLNVTGDLAVRYLAASADARTVIIDRYVVVWQIIQACFNIGGLLAGPAFLLIASGASLLGFPRWLAIWLAISGVWSLGTRLLVAVSGTDVPFFPAGLLFNIVGVIALQFAIAAALWRREAAE